MDGGRRGRRAFVEEVIGYTRDGFEHGGVIESIFANFVESIEYAERREHGEDLSPVAWQFDYLIIEEIELKEGPHLLERNKVLNFLDFVGAEHKSLNMPRSCEVLKLVAWNVVEDEVESDQRGDLREVSQRDDPAVIERQHL